MVWANATDNQQVDKPVKPVATISRFAKIKNTQPWYQHFNLVVSPEFSENHFSGEEITLFPDTKQISYFSRYQDQLSTSVHARLGGQIKSISIYARVGYTKTNHSELRSLRSEVENDDGMQSLSKYENFNYQENGKKVEFTLFGQYQFTPLLHIGYELYREWHDVDGKSQENTFIDCLVPNIFNPPCQAGDTKILDDNSGSYDWDGDALGGRINLGARYDYNHTQFTIGYAYSRDRYRGKYFNGVPVYIKFGHHVNLDIYHTWRYGLSTELNLSQVHEDANYDKSNREVGGNISQIVSFKVKKLVTEKIALSLNYTRINFSDYRQDYNFSAWYLRFDYQFSNNNAPRRRKRHNNLMRAING
jgi:predicted porin